jgi:decaprenylphospho-beta-D-ribofuranose 2-oxidase
MRSDTVHAMYPALDRFRSLRARIDPGATLCSDLARRLELC